MPKTLEYTGKVVIVNCWCGIRHGIPDDLWKLAGRKKEESQQLTIYCPLGHGWIRAGQTEAQIQAEREREWREASDARAQALEDQLLTEKRQHAATKGKVTKMRKRIAAGVCPCCNRSFTQVRRHMETQHPDEAALVFSGGGGR